MVRLVSTTANSNAFDIVANDVACQMLIFSKTKTLVTVEAHPFTATFWDDKQNFSNVLDCYALYTVAARRPDTAVAVRFVEA